MLPGTTTAAWTDVDDFVAAFESAQAGAGPSNLTEFVPDEPHPLHRAVASELIRVDLEYSWKRGCPKRVEEYRPLFPQLFQDPEILASILFEEYRLRRQAGEWPCPTEYHERFGVRPRL